MLTLQKLLLSSHKIGLYDCEAGGKFSMKYGSASVKQKGPRFRFISDIIAELKKVVWLTRREAAYLTLMVIIVTATVGLVLGIIDYGFTKLVNDLFRLGG